MQMHTRSLKTRVRLMFATSLCMAFTAGPLYSQTPKQLGPLITAGQLEARLGNRNLRILDLGPHKEEFAKSHIPNAIYVDWLKDISDQEKPEAYNLIGKRAMERLMSRLGISRTSRIVVYDNLSSRLAMRMYWTLRCYGHKNVHVLDGGFASWLSSGKPLSDANVQVTPTRYEIGAVNDEYLADMNFIAQRLQSADFAIIDGRPPDQFAGVKPGRVYHTGAEHKQRGHIPGAVNVFWKDNLKTDGTFKSKSDLKKLYGDVVNAKTVVTYCNEGLHAVPAWFVLSEILRQPGVRVYDRSMAEWANVGQPTVVSRDIVRSALVSPTSSQPN